jgi:hypothetical protein
MCVLLYVPTQRGRRSSKTSEQIEFIKVEVGITHRASEMTMFPATETMTPTYVGGMPIMS